MRPEELCIGDWVEYRFTGWTEKGGVYKDYQYVQISTIGDLYVKADNDRVASADGEEFYPIPLTPEILEKNGWKHEFDKKDYMAKYDLAVEDKNCWMMWAVKEHNLDIQRQDEKLDMYNLKVQRVCMPCDFVHELQHAIRICGIEKEIEL